MVPLSHSLATTSAVKREPISVMIIANDPESRKKRLSNCSQERGSASSNLKRMRS